MPAVRESRVRGACLLTRGRCEPCAARTFAAVGRSGKTHVTIGAILIGATAIAFLFVAWVNGGMPTKGKFTTSYAAPLAERIPELPAVATLSALAALGIGLIVRGAVVMPRQSRSRPAA